MYSGSNLTTSEICSITTPNTPFVIDEEWIASEGTVQIITTAVTGTNGLPALKYEISFNNITYRKGNLFFNHDTFTFGNYVTN
jgi:hypothetical protein